LNTHKTALGDLLAQGRTADIYVLSRDAVIKVLRSGFPNELIQIEADKTRAVAAMGVPVPRILDVTAVDGRPALIVERVDGDSLVTRLLSRPQRMIPLARLLADMRADVGADQRRLAGAGRTGEADDHGVAGGVGMLAVVNLAQKGLGVGAAGLDQGQRPGQRRRFAGAQPLDQPRTRDVAGGGVGHYSTISGSPKPNSRLRQPTISPWVTPASAASTTRAKTLSASSFAARARASRAFATSP